MSEERRQFDVLTRHFFGGFLDNDLMSPVSDMHGLLSKALALLVLPGVLYPFSLVFRYGGRPFYSYQSLDMLSWSDKCIFVMLSIVVMGLATVLEWDALQLDRRDCLAFGALPIRSRTILLAKLAALGKFLLLFSVPLTALGALSFPLVMHAGWKSGWMHVTRCMAGHVVATMAASWCVFFALLAARGVMQCVLGQRVLRRAAAAVQLVTMLSLVVVLLTLPLIASNTAAFKRGVDGAAGLAPQMWFMGMYKSIAGQGDADWHRLAARGWLALVAAAATAIGASVVAYRRVLGTTLEAVQAGATRRSWAMGLVNAVGFVVARHPVERGFFSFTVLTLVRSPWHRVVLAAFFGGALALSMVTLDLATVERDGVGRTPVLPAYALAMQFVVLVIVLAGVKASAAAPAEVRASWVLRMLDTGRPQRWMAGFRKGVMVAIVGPVVALMGGAVWLQYGWHAAWTYGLSAVVFAMLAFEVLFLEFGRVPFACTFDGASTELKVRWYLAAALFTSLVVSLARLVSFATRTTTGIATLLAVGVGTVAWMRWRGNRALVRDGGLAFEYEDVRAQTLSLGP